MTEAAFAPLSQIQRLERALVLLAWFIELDGEVHVPLYEKFEAELAVLQATEDAKARAGERLAACRRIGGLNAISSGNLSLSCNVEPAPRILNGTLRSV